MSQLQTAPKSKFASMLEQSRTQISAALPKHMNADRMLRIALTEFRKNPELQKCNEISIIKSIVEASQLGLEPGVMGQAYLIPYKGECTLIPGYRGLITLALRSGQISTIYAEVVYDGDEFEAVLGTDPSIKHIPKYASDNVTHVYAVCKMKDGGFQFVVMSKKQVEAIRDKFSKMPTGKAWRDSFDEMAKKTAFRRLVKTIPVSIELADAISYEQEKHIDVDFTDNEAKAKFEEVQAAPDIPSDKEGEVTYEKFRQLAAQANKLKIDTSGLYHDPDSALENLETNKLQALNVILEQKIAQSKKP